MSYNKNESKVDQQNYSSLVRAWCGICYGFFDCSPTSVKCQEHIILGECNKISCSKIYNSCVRKFANFEEEINHTVCLSREDVNDFDENSKIQNSRKNNDTNYNLSEDTSIFFQKNRDETNPWEIRKENKSIKSVRKKDFILDPDSTDSYKNDFIKSKVDSIFSIHPEDVTTIKSFGNEKVFISLSQPESKNTNTNLENKSHRYTSEKFDSTKNTDFFLLNETIILNDTEQDQIKKFNNSNKPQQFKLDDNTLSMLNNFNKMNIESCKTNQILMDNVHKNSSTNKKFPSLNQNNYFIPDQFSIEEIFEIIHNETKIYKKALLKLKLEFKKRGWTTAKILRLLHEKYKNWEFLYDIKLKSICSQSEATCLFLENLLKRINE